MELVTAIELIVIRIILIVLSFTLKDKKSILVKTRTDPINAGSEYVL